MTPNRPFNCLHGRGHSTVSTALIGFLVVFLLCTNYAIFSDAKSVVMKYPQSQQSIALETLTVASAKVLVIQALDDMIGYYEGNFETMNLDGIYGLRLMEGQLSLLVKQQEELFSVGLVTELKRLQTRTAVTAEKAMHSAYNDDPAYFDQLRGLITMPSGVSKKHRRLDRRLAWQLGVDNVRANFTEAMSDQCISELIQYPSNSSKGCSISNECYTLMFGKGHREYELTHQLLYTTVAEDTGCWNRLDSMMKQRGLDGGVDGMQLEFCCNAMLEMSDNLAKMRGVVFPPYRDLFMEQEFVCPLLGFMEFLHFDWLKQILSWQHSSGCYGVDPEDVKDADTQRDPAPGGKEQKDQRLMYRNGTVVRSARDSANQQWWQLQRQEQQNLHQIEMDIQKKWVQKLDAQQQQYQYVKKHEEIVRKEREQQEVETGRHQNEIRQDVQQKLQDSQLHVKQGQQDFRQEEQQGLRQQETNLQQERQNLRQYGQRNAQKEREQEHVNVQHERLNLRQPGQQNLKEQNLRQPGHHLQDKDRQNVQNVQQNAQPQVHNEQQRQYSDDRQQNVIPQMGQQPKELQKNDQQNSQHNALPQIPEGRQKRYLNDHQQDVLPKMEQAVEQVKQDSNVLQENLLREQQRLQAKMKEYQEEQPPRASWENRPQVQQQAQRARQVRQQNIQLQPGRLDIQPQQQQQEVQRQQRLQPLERQPQRGVQAPLPQRQQPKEVEVNRHQSRRLLVEKELSDGCYSHKTAVAAGALIVYLRFLLLPGPASYRDSVRIDGTNVLYQRVPPTVVPVPRRKDAWDDDRTPDDEIDPRRAYNWMDGLKHDEAGAPRMVQDEPAFPSQLDHPEGKSAGDSHGSSLLLMTSIAVALFVIYRLARRRRFFIRYRAR